MRFQPGTSRQMWRPRVRTHIMQRRGPEKKKSYGGYAENHRVITVADAQTRLSVSWGFFFIEFFVCFYSSIVFSLEYITQMCKITVCLGSVCSFLAAVLFSGCNLQS